MAQPKLPNFTIKDLLEAGVHFGHRTMLWNPKMASYIYGERQGIHIIDLQQTEPMLHRALLTVYEVLRKNGRVLFVGTKMQAVDIVAEEARRCGQYYVNNRWLGGMLTNFSTVSASVKQLEKLEKNLNEPEEDENAPRYTKKERLELSRQYNKLERALGGIRNMGGMPDLLFIIDTNKESTAIKEANKLGIPIIAIIDSNSDPTGITYKVPGNDDSTKSIRLYCRLIADAAIYGIEDAMRTSGADIGAKADNPMSVIDDADSELAIESNTEEVVEKEESDTSKTLKATTTTKKPAAAKKTKSKTKSKGEDE